jgi:AraC-like DNA-binding protein
MILTDNIRAGIPMLLLNLKLILMQINHRNLEKFRDVEQFIMCNLEKRIHIADIAIEFRLSESYLRKGFKLCYGITLHQYHLKKSMVYALAEMQKGEQIKSIAIRFGYYFPGSFTRAFKSVHNFAPQHHRMYVRV